MAYTVNKLAKLSGVSVRTLHFYDEIGLLKPAFLGENNYRYYEEEQLLNLQQILFYRELGFQLDDIKKIILSSDFDKLTALESHRSTLIEQLNQSKTLLETVDKTIAYLRGNKPMKLEEIFHGFDAEKQKMYEDFLVESGVDENVIDQCRDKVQTWTKAQWMDNKREADDVHAQLVVAINNNLVPNSPEVQKIIKKHYQMVTQFWTPNRETYIGLSQLYASHPDFVKFYADIHPKLLKFLMEAMKIFAEKNLS